MTKLLPIDTTFDHKPGRPGRDATFTERLHWTLWQCWAHHPDDSEAYAAHKLVVEFKAWKELEKELLRESVAALATETVTHFTPTPDRGT